MLIGFHDGIERNNGGGCREYGRGGGERVGLD